jgi:primary-amine oxidase
MLAAMAMTLVAGGLRAADTSVAHPLDPLTKDEILKTAEVLRAAGKMIAKSRFSLIALHEPPKDEVIAFQPGSTFRRESFSILYDREHNATFEAVVDLRRSTVVSWKQIPGVQPSVLDEDIEMLERAIRADPRFAKAMNRRGIKDLDRVGIGDWAGGYFGNTEEGYRFRRAEFFYKDSASSSDRVIENVTAEVNLNTGAVVGFTDGDIVPIPPVGAGIDGMQVEKTREAPKPFIITQPQGASFEVRGQEVRWQHWRFRFGLHPREGLILYTVGYEDEGRLRSVMYRGSCSEMVVPYGDPSFGWFFRNAFDAGEDSFGRLASPLESLTDYPPNAVTFDAVMPTEKGDWFLIPKAVALYERDGGLAWKHHDRGRNRNESRRARELVLSWVATVGNYDYGFNWVFHQDGSLEMETLLTGFMETKAVALKALPDAAHDHQGELVYGHLVAENLLAVHHQHFFSFRLDMDIDGSQNSVVEMNTEALPPGPANPYLNAFTMKETVLHNERDAVRQMSLQSSRRWTVFNPEVRNALGYPAGYTLLPGENSVPYAAPESWVRKRAGFINAPFWVTRLDPNQIYAAGLYVNQSRGDDGLHRWVEANRPIENQDVVLWYTMGITHLPRVEEHPIMSVHKATFKLVPNGFFNRNPAIDLPK